MHLTSFRSVLLCPSNCRGAPYFHVQKHTSTLNHTIIISHLEIVKNVIKHIIEWIRNILFIYLWPQRSLAVTKVYPILALTQPFTYWMVRWLCGSLSLYLSLSLSLNLVLSSPHFLLLSLYNIYPSLSPSLSPSCALCKH